jgi:hypothetical protein
MLPDATLRQSEKAGVTGFRLAQSAPEPLQAAFQASKALRAELLRAPYAIYFVACKTHPGPIAFFQAR